MAEMKTLQVFDIMSMPDRNVVEALLCAFEMGSDSYHRWYPKLGWGSNHGDLTELDEQVTNAWLRENGMVVDPDDKFFHVLLHSSY